MKLYSSCQRSEGKEMRYISPPRTPPPKTFQLFINNSAKRLGVFSSTGRTCKIKHYCTRGRNSNCFPVDRATTEISFHRRHFHGTDSLLAKTAANPSLRHYFWCHSCPGPTLPGRCGRTPSPRRGEAGSPGRRRGAGLYL